MADAKFSAKVEAVSSKFDGGLLIEGKWYNGTSKTGEFVKAIKKGATVELELDDRGKISYVKEVADKSPEPRPDFRSAEQIELSPEEKAVILNSLVVSYEGLMKVCKDATDRVFSADPNYKESMGAHCNSLFIALDRSLAQKGIRL